MISVDMDGTLLGSDGKVSARNLAALKAAEQAGVEVVVATGRRHCYAMRQLRGLGLSEENALISSNGTVTRTLGTTLIERNLMAGPTALWLCGHVDEFRNSLVITFDKVGTGWRGFARRAGGGGSGGAEWQYRQVDGGE